MCWIATGYRLPELNQRVAVVTESDEIIGGIMVSYEPEIWVSENGLAIKVCWWQYPARPTLHAADLASPSAPLRATPNR